jgi:hypothetical protein
VETCPVGDPGLWRGACRRVRVPISFALFAALRETSYLLEKAVLCGIMPGCNP